MNAPITPGEILLEEYLITPSAQALFPIQNPKLNLPQRLIMN
jgi:hypothetical protein